MARSSSAEPVRRNDTVRTVTILQGGMVLDSQPRGSSSAPSAGAVMRDAATNAEVSWSVAIAAQAPHQEVIAAAEFFRTYDESAEDAAELLIGQTL